MTSKDDPNWTPWIVTVTWNVPGLELPPISQVPEHDPSVPVVQDKSCVVEPEAYSMWIAMDSPCFGPSESYAATVMV